MELLAIATDGELVGGQHTREDVAKDSWTAPAALGGSVLLPMDFYQHLVVFLELRELESREEKEREKGTLRLVSGIRPLCINFGWILLF